MISFRCALPVLAVISLLSLSPVSGETIRESELKRIELNKKYDKYKLREKSDFVTDTSGKFLIEPEPEAKDRNFIVAEKPPTVKMRSTGTKESMHSRWSSARKDAMSIIFRGATTAPSSNTMT